MRLIDADSIYPWYLKAFKENKELGLKGIKPSEPRFSMNDIKENLDNIPTISCIQSYPDDSWTKVEDGLPDEFEDVLCYYEYYRYGDYNCMYRTYGVGYMSIYDGQVYWDGDVKGHKSRVIAWKRFNRYPGEVPNKEIGEDLDDQDN